jgi:ADP-ribosylglycohydrolase
MIGAIAGDIIGSPYEFNAIKTTEFPLFDIGCRFTDDTVLTMALADAILHNEDYVSLMKQYYLRFPDVGYGGTFIKWAASSETQPYNSFGNGAAMRISPVGFYYNTLDEVLEKAAFYTAVTHNHPEGIKGAQATAAAIFLARSGSSKDEIQRYITGTFGYNLNRTCDQIRPGYTFEVTCQGTVPEAIICFLESNDFESAVRLAVSLGGDSDTQACIVGGIAEAFYGVPEWIAEKALQILDPDLRIVQQKFSSFCGIGVSGE